MSTAMTPVVAFGVFTILAKIRHTHTLDIEIVFTSLTLFELLAAPVSVLIETLAGVMSAVGSFQRIGQYLATEARVDHRITTGEKKIRPDSELSLTLPLERLDLQIQSALDLDLDLDLNIIESTTTTLVGSLENIPKAISTISEKTPNCMVIRKSSAGWDSKIPPILTDLTFEIKRSQLTMIIGPVGCGKSTLLKTLLGETPNAPGIIEKEFEDAAYCSQTPWLTNGTVQQNILGVSEMDETWYNTVIRACVLDIDISQFKGGDQMMVGSKGITLSGGQQMRLVSFFHQLYTNNY
jgi:ATP-binding cassette subfamily C (CFTR/MRP) protein 1